MIFKMKKKTDNTRNVYEFCKNYIAKHGYAPSNREICYGTGIKSTCTVHDKMNELYDLGVFESENRGQPRAFRIVEDYDERVTKYV
jgi:SOS-response transcriptional repressor LexA